MSRLEVLRSIILILLTLCPANDPAGWLRLAFAQGITERCDDDTYSGIRHCTRGAIHILRIDPQDPQVRLETVLPQGYDRDGHFGECRDVNIPQLSTGPGCQLDGQYPAEQVGEMADRYPGAVAAFNADFFSFPEYRHGPEGLTVKNGERLDGLFNDRDENEVRRASLSIARDGQVRIGMVDRDSLPNPRAPWTWHPDPDAYYTSVSGLPLLVQQGVRVPISDQCRAAGQCPAPYAPRGRTAVGQRADGELIVVVIPDTPETGLTLGQLADLMIELGAVEALNLDGGGSSQLWYDGRPLVFSPRPVAEGLLVFSEPRQESPQPQLRPRSESGRLNS